MSLPEQVGMFRKRLVFKLIFVVGFTLLVTISFWSHFNIRYQEKKLMNNVLTSTDRLTNTIKLGAHYAMMLNSRNDINQIINNISKQPEFENIRIYNKEGRIKFSNDASEVEHITNIKAEACDICHRKDPPFQKLDLDERTRIFKSPRGYRLLGIISPIENEPGCSTVSCHIHPRDKKILGALDVVVSLKKTDMEIHRAVKGGIMLASVVFLMTSAIIFIFVLLFVNRPIRELIDGTRRIAKGEYLKEIRISQDDEMGHLASAINFMGSEIQKNQEELNRQRDEYQDLFERVPCLITVQDRNYKLLKYNREFADRFDPSPGDFCYHAYKGFDRKCAPCPVENTFRDGSSHYAEESGIDKDGSPKYWIVRTSPIFDKDGNVTAAMEISHDITERKSLEVELQKSEKKYHAIFNNIPNPVFVLDEKNLNILDCNNSVETVYRFKSEEIIGTSFSNLFPPEERAVYERKIRSSSVVNMVKQKRCDGKHLFVNIRVSPSEYSEKKVLLVTTSDITKRLETEQQLIQASKMATLGEMATGVAHELNQPLSVIKTVSSFFIDKIEKSEEIDKGILSKMLVKVDGNVDRATRIINHMRQFARKSDCRMEKVQVSDILENAIEIFSQQLKIRGIRIIFEKKENLPQIYGDPGRLEQVFINLLINARDAIEMMVKSDERKSMDHAISIHTNIENQKVVVSVCDTGPGVPEGIADKIFEPFFTTKEVGKGTGLGLSISYGIIKDCGGEIHVEPGQKKGACFVIRFPVPSGKLNPDNHLGVEYESRE